MKSKFILAGVFCGIIAASAAVAAPYPLTDPCTYLGGGGRCGTSTAGVIKMVNTAIVAIATFLALGGGALAVLYVVIGGFQMLLSYGDDSKFTRGKTSIIWALVGFGLVLGSQMIVNFIAAQASIAAGAQAPILKLMEVVVSTILGLLNVFFVIIIMTAGIRAIISRGKQEQYTQAKHAVGYAIAGALVINLARALAHAVLNALG